MPKTRWYDRWRPSNDPRQARAGERFGRLANAGLYDNADSYNYLLDSLRINAPGYSEQNTFELSRAFVGVPYLAIHSFALQAMQADVQIYEVDLDDPESKKPLSKSEDIVQLLDDPNPDDTFGEIIEQIAIQQKLTGTALLWLPPDDDDLNGPPREMYCLSTASVIPQPISPRYPNGAYLVQPWYPAGPYAQVPVSQGVGSIIPAEQIVRIKEPHPFFRWIGYATLWAISQQADTARQIDVSRSNAMRQGIDPSGTLTFDPSVKQPTPEEIRRLQAQLQAVWAGPDNARRIAVIPAGGKLEPYSNSPAEMAYQEGWSQIMDFCLAAIGVSKGITGQTEDINYATLFAETRGFYMHSLNPFLWRVAAKFNKLLIHPFYNRSFFLELKGQKITDEQVRDAELKTRMTGGLNTVNELRKMLGDPPAPEEWGEERAFAGQKREPEGQGPGADPFAPETKDGETEKNRPVNKAGKGSLGPKDRLNQIASRMEKSLSNGTAQPHRNGGV